MIRASLNALLAHRGAPRKVRRPLASATATAIRLHAPNRWENYMTWALVCATDPPTGRKRKEPTLMDDSGKIIEETSSETAAYDRAKASPTNGHGPAAAAALEAARHPEAT